MTMIAAWTDFIGANLKLHPKRLGDGVGVDCQNLRPGSADLRGWKAAQTVVTTGGATPLISAYRMGRAAASDTASWMQWTVDVDVARSLIANDTTEEIYFTGDGVPKRTNNVLGLPAAPGPAATRTLGIPKPTAAMTTATLVAGTGASEVRVYVDTFVNDQGRESAPGTAATFTCPGGTTVTLASLSSVPGGYPDVTLRRIYVSTDGGEFLRIREIAAGTTSTTDDMTRGSVLDAGGSSSTPAQEQPLAGMVGLIDLWNSMLGGFFGKSYMVCEPGRPWAWPVEYQEVVPDDIVGTGKWQQNWLILTTSLPVLVTGSSPLSLSNQLVPFRQACVAKRSIVSMGYGVCWASPNGLCYMGQDGPRVVTEGLLSAEQWQALVPSTIIGAKHDRYYLGFYNDGAAKGFLIDPQNPDGIIFLTQGARGAYYDPISDRLYLQDTGNTIKRWNHPGASALSVTFKTGVKRHPQPTNPGYGLVVADTPISVAVTLWGDGTSRFTRTVTSGEPFALPAGYMAQDFQAQMVTTGPVQGLLIAEDASDLI